MTNQDKWITALKSGSYTQGVGALHTKSGCFCALGVALHALGFEPEDDPYSADYVYGGNCATAPDYLIEALALQSSNGSVSPNPDNFFSIVEMNDAENLTLPEIGAWIEANREKVFTHVR